MLNQAKQQVSQDQAKQQVPQDEETNSTPEEQAAYEQAMEAIGEALYADDKVSENIIQMVVSDSDPVSGLTKATVQVITEVDKQVDMPEEVILGTVRETSARIVEMVEAVHGETFDEPMMEKSAGAAIDMLLEAYGVDEDDAQMIAQSVQGDMPGIQQKYKELTS